MENLSLFQDPRLLQELSIHGRLKQLHRDDTLIRPGDEVQFVPILLQGSIRIVREDDDGREVFLYHLYPGQTCALSINCCQSGKKSPVRAIVEDDVNMILIPANLVDDWFRFPEWKAFIHQTYGLRFNELLSLIDLISFNSMDKQLLHYLQERTRASHSTVLNITHQQIADELHAHREAISRLLRTMEQKNLVRLGRNTIEVLG